MTQPRDPSRDTRRVPRQSGVWAAVPSEQTTDDPALSAISGLQAVIEYLCSRHGSALPSQGTYEQFQARATESLEQLRAYVATRERERQQITREAAEQFNQTRIKLNARVVELESQVSDCRTWIETHDPMLVQNEKVIDALDAELAQLKDEHAQLQAKHKQAQDEIVRQSDDNAKQSQEVARLNQVLKDMEQAQETQKRLRATATEVAHRADLERLRKENEGLRKDLGKIRAERDKAQADLEVSRASASKATEAKLTVTREFDAFKHQVGSKIVQPILVIATSEQVAKGKGKTEDDWVKLFPKANFARFMVKILEAATKLAQGKCTPAQLIETVRNARIAEVDPFYPANPSAPSAELLDLALSECQVWFTQLMLGFKEKIEQVNRLIEQRNAQRVEIEEVDQFLKEMQAALVSLRAAQNTKQ